MAMVECGVTHHLKLGCLFEMIFIDGHFVVCVGAVSENFSDHLAP